MSVAGAVEEYVDFETGERGRKATGGIAVVHQADPRPTARRRLPLNGAVEVAVTQSEDGLLTSVSGSTKGVVPEVVGAGAAVLGFAAGLAGKVVSGAAVPVTAATLGESAPRGAEKAGGPEPTPLETWESENQADASRLRAAVEALGEVHDAIIATARKTARPRTSPAADYRRLIALRQARVALEDEIAGISTRRGAWLATRYPTTVERYTFLVATDRTFKLRSTSPTPPQTVERSELDDSHAEPAREALDTLGVALVEFVYGREAARPDGQPGEITIADAEDANTKAQDLEHGRLPLGVDFRVPRPYVLAVYKDANPGDDGRETRRLMLERVDRLWVVDERSRLGFLDLQSGASNQMKGSVAFSAAGFPVGVSSAETSAIADFAKALGTVPERLAGGMSHAKSLAEGWDALYKTREERDADAAQRQIDALERRKKLLETQVANRGLEASGREQTTLQELRDQLERRKLESEISAFGYPAAPTAADLLLEQRKEVLESLRVEVGIARAEAALAAFDGSPSE